MVYDNELQHFGIKGMKWGKRTITKIKKANDDYKIKIDKIANSKTAHPTDVEIAKKVNKSMTARVAEATTQAVISTLAADLFTGRLKNYGRITPQEAISKFTNIGKDVAMKLASDEAFARSVANKYDIHGNRVKGKNSSRFTREEVAGAAISTVNTAIKLAPVIRLLAGMHMSQVNEKRRAGEAAFNRWGGRILNDSNPDYSNIIPNVKYTVN